MKLHPFITVAMLALGATLGATSRYYVGLWALDRFGLAFPWGTLIVNLVGSFVLGCFLTIVARRSDVSPALRLFVATGFCGSLTTFSTFSAETETFLREGNYLFGGAYAFGSLALGLLGVIVGSALGRVLTP